MQIVGDSLHENVKCCFLEKIRLSSAELAKRVVKIKVLIINKYLNTVVSLIIVTSESFL